MDNSYYESNNSMVPMTDGGFGSNVPMNVVNLAPVTFDNPNNRSIRKVERRLEAEAHQEYCKARLAQTVIGNTMSLACIADHAATLVPSSEQPVREIVRTYALSSAQRIAERW